MTFKSPIPMAVLLKLGEHILIVAAAAGVAAGGGALATALSGLNLPTVYALALGAGVADGVKVVIGELNRLDPEPVTKPVAIVPRNTMPPVR